MRERPDALVFDYDSFAPVPDDQWEGSELIHAMTLATVIAADLSQVEGFSPGEPIQEDFGAVLPVSGPKGGADIIISFYPRDSSDFGWALQFEDQRGLLGTLFRRTVNREVVEPVMFQLDRLTAQSADRFKNREWVKASSL